MNNRKKSITTDDKFILLLDRISEVSERTARIEAELSNVKTDVEGINYQDAIQNKLLEEHIRGVQTANERLSNEIEARKLIQTQQESLHTRITSLEEAPKFRATLKQYLIGIGGVAGAMVAIFKLLKFLGM
jgi:chromosome segregation ATPase